MLVALLAAVLLGASSASAAGRPLPARLASALAVPHVDRATSGVLAVELSTGAVVFARNRGLALAPASTEKLAVSFALLRILGPMHRIETRVLGSGALHGATWRGDLVLQGQGDPTLSTASLRKLAAQVRAQGVTRVTGRVIGDESFFDARRTAPGWKPSYYIGESPPLSALVVDRARYRGAVSGNPALAAATILRAALASAGVAVASPAVVGRAQSEDALLGRLTSPPLQTILRAVNGESDNFTAEMLLKHLGGVSGGAGTTGSGAALVREALAAAGIPVAGARIADASGLSLLNRLTAETLVGILTAAWQDPLLRASFLSTLAVAGRRGTLEKRLRAPPAAGNVFAKTGTTARACALAGYAGGRYAFAVIQNGLPVSTWWSRRAQDRFVTVLAAG